VPEPLALALAGKGTTCVFDMVDTTEGGNEMQRQNVGESTVLAEGRGSRLG